MKKTEQDIRFKDLIEISSLDIFDDTILMDVPVSYLESMIETFVNTMGLGLVPIYDEDLKEEDIEDYIEECKSLDIPHIQEYIRVEIDYERENEEIYTMINYEPYFNVKTLEICDMREDFMLGNSLYTVSFMDFYDLIEEKVSEEIRNLDESDVIEKLLAEESMEVGYNENKEELQLPEIMDRLIGLKFKIDDVYFDEYDIMIVLEVNRKDFEEKLK